MFVNRFYRTMRAYLINTNCRDISHDISCVENAAHCMSCKGTEVEPCTYWFDALETLFKFTLVCMESTQYKNAIQLIKVIDDPSLGANIRAMAFMEQMLDYLPDGHRFGNGSKYWEAVIKSRQDLYDASQSGSEEDIRIVERKLENSKYEFACKTNSQLQHMNFPE